MEGEGVEELAKMKRSSKMSKSLTDMEVYMLSFLFKSERSFFTPHDHLMEFMSKIKTIIMIPEETLHSIFRMADQIVPLIFLCIS